MPGKPDDVLVDRISRECPQFEITVFQWLSPDQIAHVMFVKVLNNKSQQDSLTAASFMDTFHFLAANLNFVHSLEETP